MGHHAAAPAHAGHVHLVHPGELHYGAHVVGIDPGPRHQAGPPRQRLLHRLQGLEARQRGRRVARAQNALAAGGNYGLQVEAPVGGEVDGAVEGNAKGPCRLHQLGEFGGRHPSLFVQQTDHYSLQAGGAGRRDILQHHLELPFAKAEVAGPGPDHGVDGNGGMARRQLHEAIGGSQAAQPQRRAELDAIRASLLGGKQGFQIVDTDFKRGHDGLLYWGDQTPDLIS